MQFANARSDLLIFAPSLSFWPKLFVSEALSLLKENCFQLTFADRVKRKAATPKEKLLPARKINQGKLSTKNLTTIFSFLLASYSNLQYSV